MKEMFIREINPKELANLSESICTVSFKRASARASPEISPAESRMTATGSTFEIRVSAILKAFFTSS